MIKTFIDFVLLLYSFFSRSKVFLYLFCTFFDKITKKALFFAIAKRKGFSGILCRKVSKTSTYFIQFSTKSPRLAVLWVFKSYFLQNSPLRVSSPWGRLFYRRRSSIRRVYSKKFFLLLFLATRSRVPRSLLRLTSLVSSRDLSRLIWSQARQVSRRSSRLESLRVFWSGLTCRVSLHDFEVLSSSSMRRTFSRLESSPKSCRLRKRSKIPSR